MLETLYPIFLKHSVVCIDTRAIKPGCIFFALKGPNFNANEFAYKALEQGASYAVVDEEKYVLDQRYILVANVLECLQQLANHHRKQLQCPILAITGTNGKTTSKELIHAVLKQKYRTSATLGNLNNHIGVPLSLLSIPNDTEIAIIEMGANHEGEIDFLCNIAQPNIGVITNIGKAHLEGFGSVEGVLRTKTELYRHLNSTKGTVFYKDNQQNLIEQLPENSENLSYGQLNNSNFKIKFNSAQSFVSIITDGELINSKLIGDYNFDNLALSIAIGQHFGIEVKEIKKGIENYTPTNNRSQLIKTNNNTLLLDAYNANPMSVEKAIHNMINIEHSHKVLILGDMFELGEDSAKEHINIINHCLGSGFTNVYLVGDAFSKVNNTSYPSFATSKELIAHLGGNPIKDAFILIKGSRGMKLEELEQHL